MVDVVTELTREVALSELLYTDDLVLMSVTIEELRNKILKWKEAFENKGLKANFGKTKAVVSSGSSTPGTTFTRSRAKRRVLDHRYTVGFHLPGTFRP